MTERILIASNSFDAPVTNPVATRLAEQGYDVIQYNADLVSIGEIPFTTTITNEGFEIYYDGLPLQPQEIAAAWSRRPHDFGPYFDTEDRGTRTCLDREVSNSQQLLLDSIPHERWLNAPDSMRSASHKLAQLVLARSIGFEIPSTVVTNQWEEVLSRLEEGTVTYKPFYGELHEGNKTRHVYSTSLQNDKTTPPVEGLPYPGIWQDHQQKTREWRITVVGDNSFDVIVDTDEDARDDWRRHQWTPKVRFCKGEFPDSEKEKCHELLNRYNLRFGAFDFIERPDGQIVFLEMNPNGQYSWLESKLDLPISEAIVRELAHIAIGGDHIV
jgi:glutathione synthase/RimK-type ligase-like ATP-grasp enzyme